MGSWFSRGFLRGVGQFRPQRGRAVGRRRPAYRHTDQRVGPGMSAVARALRRRGPDRLASPGPPPAANRCVWDRPGDLLHLDIKKLGASAGPATAPRASAAPAPPAPA